MRLARVLLVAGQHHDHPAPGEQPLLDQRPQRFDDHHVAALHVGGTAAVGAGALAAERFALEDGVEMTDHQNPRPGAARGNAGLGDEVSGPAHRG